MYVLIVDGFSDNAKGRSAYNIFRTLVAKTIQSCDVPDCVYLERSINRLGDLVVDWEHDILNDNARAYCKNFDKVDFVFIAGDMHVCPWEPVATQAVTLIHMCKFTKKPLFCSGFGAYAAVYTLAAKGARFHVLNGPDGDEIEHLARFPRYSIGTGAYPSGWLDNETGDLYTYNRNNMTWDPVCNIGIYRVAANGTPSSNRHAPLTKKYTRENSILDTRQVADVNSTTARIRSDYVQHYSVRGFEAQNCVMKAYPHWFVRSDNSLPAGENIEVIADGEKGAVLLAKDNMLILSSKIDKSLSYADSARIVSNYVGEMMRRIRAANRDKLESSMLEFLFGKHGFGGGTYDSTHAKVPMSPALSRQPVRTTLPDGPIKVDPPAIGMFLYTPKQDNVDYLALTANRRNSTLGRKPAIRVQNPLNAHQKRLLKLTATLHGDATGSLASTSRSITAHIGGSPQASPTKATSPTSSSVPGRVVSAHASLVENETAAPEYVRELFAGILMNDRSISQRRMPRSPPSRLTTANSEAPPTLERLLAEATLQAQQGTDYDHEVTDYSLEQHMRPFGESWVIPGRSNTSRGASPRTAGPPRAASRGFGVERFVDENELAEVMLTNVGHGAASQDPQDAPQSPHATAAQGGSFFFGSVASNNVPFASSTSPRSRSPCSAPATSAGTAGRKAVTPQQPATPRSSANAARLSSQLNREYRKHVTQLKRNVPEVSAEELAARAWAAYEEDSSDDDTPLSGSNHAGGGMYPAGAGMSMDSMDHTSAWSSQISGNRVPAFPDWGMALRTASPQGGRGQSSLQSQSAREPGHYDGSQSLRYGSMRSSRVFSGRSQLLAPTSSSMQRSLLTSQIGRVDPAPQLAFPLPQTPRTAEDIVNLRRSLRMPLTHPTGPVTGKPKVPQSGPNSDDSDEEGGEHAVMDPESTHGLLVLPAGSMESQVDHLSGSSQFRATGDHYHTARTPQVTLKSQIHQERPYSSFHKLTRKLQTEREGPYQGAFKQGYMSPDQVERKEYMKSREKFLAGQFRTVIGAANTYLPVRPEGGVRGEGQYPLEPPGNAGARPEKITAVHFAGMLPRSRRPPLAGAWK